MFSARRTILADRAFWSPLLIAAVTDKIFGMDWAEIQARQMKQHTTERVDLSKPGDYGSDPLGDGTFRMVPSGDIVDLEERNRRLAK